jgi:drug/metabolite transporter (DMT)-like permease
MLAKLKRLNQLDALSLALISTALGALTSVMFKYLFEVMPYQEVALIESVFLVLFFLAKTPIRIFGYSWREKTIVLMGSLLNGLSYLFFFLSLSELAAVEFSFIGRNQTFISILLGIIFFGERYSFLMWVAMALALLGAYCFTYTSLESGSVLGVIYAICYCFLISLRGFFLKIGPSLSSREHMLWGSLFSLIFVAFSCFFMSQEPLNWQRMFTAKHLGVIIATTLLAQVVGITIYLKALYQEGFSKISAVRATSPFFVFIYSLFIFQYNWTALKTLAIVLSAASIILFIYEQRKIQLERAAN